MIVGVLFVDIVHALDVDTPNEPYCVVTTVSMGYELWGVGRISDIYRHHGIALDVARKLNVLKLLAGQSPRYCFTSIARLSLRDQLKPE